MSSSSEASLINPLSSPGCKIDGRIGGRLLPFPPYMGQGGTGSVYRMQRLRPASCLPAMLGCWWKTQHEGESQHQHGVLGGKARAPAGRAP